MITKLSSITTALLLFISALYAQTPTRPVYVNATNNTVIGQIKLDPANATNVATALAGIGYGNGRVLSVNGQTGNVVVAVPVQSVNGSTGAVSVAVPVQSVNGQTGAVALSFADLASISAGSNVVVVVSGTNYTIHVPSFPWSAITGAPSFDPAGTAVAQQQNLSNSVFNTGFLTAGSNFVFDVSGAAAAQMLNLSNSVNSTFTPLALLTGGTITNGTLRFFSAVNGPDTNSSLLLGSGSQGILLYGNYVDGEVGWESSLNFEINAGAWKFSHPLQFPDDTIQSSAGITNILSGTPNVTLGTNGYTITVNVSTQDLSGLLQPSATQNVFQLSAPNVITATNTMRSTLYINDALRINRWFSNASDTVFAVQTPGAASSMARMYHSAGTGVVLSLQGFEGRDTNGTVNWRITTQPITNLVSTTGFSTWAFTNGTGYLTTTNGDFGIFKPSVASTIWTNGATVDSITVTNFIYYTGPDNSGNQLATKDWTRTLLEIGNVLYCTTNALAFGTQEPTNHTYAGSTTVPANDGTLVFPITTNNQYAVAMTVTNIYPSGTVLHGPASIGIYMTRNSAGGGSRLSVKPELYYAYTNDLNTLHGDWSAAAQAITVTTTNVYRWTLAFPNTTLTNAARLLFKLKVTDVNNVTQAIIAVGQTFPSFAQLRTPGGSTVGGITEVLSTAGPITTNSATSITIGAPTNAWSLNNFPASIAVTVTNATLLNATNFVFNPSNYLWAVRTSNATLRMRWINLLSPRADGPSDSLAITWQGVTTTNCFGSAKGYGIAFLASTPHTNAVYAICSVSTNYGSPKQVNVVNGSSGSITFNNLWNTIPTKTFDGQGMIQDGNANLEGGVLYGVCTNNPTLYPLVTLFPRYTNTFSGTLIFTIENEVNP